MKLVKRLGLLAMIIMAPVTAQAVDVMQKTIPVGQILRGQFIETRTLQGFTAPLKSNGNFVIVPGQGLLWSTVKPFAVTTIIKPTGVKQIANGASTMDLPAEKVPFLSRLYTMLSGTLAGDWMALENDFIITKSGTADNWRVSLAPRQKDDLNVPFSEITVTGAEFVNHVDMKKSDGDTDEIDFFQQKVTASELSTTEADELK